MKYAIVGLGRSGTAARNYLLHRGVLPDEIITFDSRLAGADYADPHQMLTVEAPDVLVVSPGVPLSLPWLKAAQKNGVHISSEISLACEVLASEKIIGITGSVGKSTTVALLGSGAKQMDPHAFIGGNFGTPLCEYAVEVLSGQRPRAKWLILELSSFQLENCSGLTLDFAGITSLTANHLERYDSKEHYYLTKSHIRTICRSPVFINQDGDDLLEWTHQNPGRWVETSRNQGMLRPLHLESARLIGRHNQDNLALASCIALSAGWGEAAIQAMKDFSGLPHRLEDVGVIHGVRYINDSKATALSSVLIAAKSAFESKGPLGTLFLLVGGKDKNLPWEELQSLRQLSGLRFIFFGACGARAKEGSGQEGPLHPTLAEALIELKKIVMPGDWVLLSPGGTSLDEFSSFEHRGDFFKSFVRSI